MCGLVPSICACQRVKEGSKGEWGGREGGRDEGCKDEEGRKEGDRDGEKELVYFNLCMMRTRDNLTLLL